MKKLSITLLFCCFAFIGYSQDAAKTQQIKTLLELTGAGNLGVQAFENVINSFKERFIEVPEIFWTDIKKEVNANAIVEMIIPIYDKYFTEIEIKQLSEFYQTAVGKKVISTMPMVVQESMQVGQAWGEQLAEKVFKNLKEKGYIKD